MSSCKSLEKHDLTANIGTETVTVFVGNTFMRAKFVVHKTLLQKSSSYWTNNSAFESEDGLKGLIILNEEYPAAWEMFVEWLYKGKVPKAPTPYTANGIPPPLEIQRLETDLLRRFNNHMLVLVNLYGLAERYSNEPLMNQTMDNIQDGYHEFGTVFGPALNKIIFLATKPGSKLRDLCIGANIIHTDRGCTKLRQEIMLDAAANPEYFSHLLRWIARNFAMFSRREQQGYDSRRCREGFSMFNRSKLCPCHFHVHTFADDAHHGHQDCAIPFLDCSHGEDEESEKNNQEGVSKREEALMATIFCVS